jgi:hypothetical protein
MKILDWKRIARILVFSVVILAFTGGGVRAADNVSYLYEPIFSQIVELEDLNPDRGYEMVPYEVDVEGEVIESGEVLSSGGSVDCSGVSLTEGAMVCSETDHNENVSNVGSGITFSRDCTIELLAGTYPRFFFGYDPDRDNRYPPYDPDNPNQPPQWPGFAVEMMPTASDVRISGGVSSPGESFKEGARNFYPPNNSELNADLENTDFTERTEVTATPSAEGPNASMQQAGEIDFSTDECEEDPSEPGNGNCPSGIFASTQGGYIAEAFTTPSQTEITGRPISDEAVCYLVEGVPSIGACINIPGIIRLPVLRLAGILQDIECRIRGDCMEDVHLILSVDAIRGNNQGCEPPCMDYTGDMLISVTKTADPTRNCSSYEKGTNSPCFNDSYVGTPGICSVCGRVVGCTIIWQNWIRDNYEYETASLPACDPDENPYCEWDGYWDYVKERSIGLAL